MKCPRCGNKGTEIAEDFWSCAFCGNQWMNAQEELQEKAPEQIKVELTPLSVAILEELELEFNQNSHVAMSHEEGSGTLAKKSLYSGQAAAWAAAADRVRGLLKKIKGA